MVVQFVLQAASDPKVVASQQTLYRTSNHSPLVAPRPKPPEARKAVRGRPQSQARTNEDANIQSDRARQRRTGHER